MYVKLENIGQLLETAKVKLVLFTSECHTIDFIVNVVVASDVTNTECHFSLAIILLHEVLIM